MSRQLADLLRDRIRSGDLAPGASLPSEARLAQHHDVSRTIVQAALALLESEGLVNIAGRGTFVRTAEPAETVTLCKGDTVSARMPSGLERSELDMVEGVPLVVIFRADGSRELYPADRFQVGR